MRYSFKIGIFSNLTWQIWCPLFFKIQINSLTLSIVHFSWKSNSETRKKSKINKMFQLYVGPCLHCFVVLWQKRRARANYFVLIWYRQLLTQHSYEIVTTPCSRKSFRHWGAQQHISRVIAPCTGGFLSLFFDQAIPYYSLSPSIFASIKLCQASCR